MTQRTWVIAASIVGLNALSTTVPVTDPQNTYSLFTLNVPEKISIESTLSADVKAAIRSPVLETTGAIGAVATVVGFFAEQNFRQDVVKALGNLQLQLQEMNLRLKALEGKVDALAAAVDGLYPFITADSQQRTRSSVLSVSLGALELAQTAIADPKAFQNEVASQTVNMMNARQLIKKEHYVSSYLVVAQAMIAEAALHRVRLAGNDVPAQRALAVAAMNDYRDYFHNAVGESETGLASLRTAAEKQWKDAAANLDYHSRPFPQAPGGPTPGLWIGGWGPNEITPTRLSCLLLVRVNGDYRDVLHPLELSGAFSVRRNEPALPMTGDVCDAGLNYLPNDYSPTNWKSVQRWDREYKIGRVSDGVATIAIAECQILEEAAKRLAESFKK
jgi:hypothetical protein